MRFWWSLSPLGIVKCPSFCWALPWSFWAHATPVNSAINHRNLPASQSSYDADLCRSTPLDRHVLNSGTNLSFFRYYAWVFNSDLLFLCTSSPSLLSSCPPSLHWYLFWFSFQTFLTISCQCGSCPELFVVRAASFIRSLPDFSFVILSDLNFQNSWWTLLQCPKLPMQGYNLMTPVCMYLTLIICH